ncbi:MAG: hypothetical protein DWI59_03670 [Chloroflexi bacterium]|nr:MAG: hypothetical protein DWI59_03670 [Chloroflexota bacterium]
MELKKSIGSIGVGLVALASIALPGSAFAAGVDHAITLEALPVAVVGQPYTATLTDVGGSGGESWGTVMGQLPAGLSLDVRTGVISGVPTAASSVPITIGVTDDTDDMAVGRVTIDVTDPNAPAAVVAPKVPTTQIYVDSPDE